MIEIEKSQKLKAKSRKEQLYEINYCEAIPNN
jgi:hypothetical protein